MFVSRLLLIASLCACAAANMEEIKQQFAIACQECAKQHGGVIQDITSMKSPSESALKEGDFDKVMEILKQAPKNMKCFAKCVMLKTKFLGADGSINKRMFDTIHGNIEAKAEKFRMKKFTDKGKQCMAPCLNKKYPDTNGECSGAWEFVLCSFNELKPVFQGVFSKIKSLTG